MIKKIVIKGAKEHNLKNVSVEIPKDQFVVITGLSGSGKSSTRTSSATMLGKKRTPAELIKGWTANSCILDFKASGKFAGR